MSVNSSPSSPVVVDGELESLMNEIVHAVRWDAGEAMRGGIGDASRISAAREALRSYVSQKAEDTRRLDWLENAKVGVVSALNGTRHRVLGYIWPDENRDLRSAIDSAMRERDDG